MHRTLRRPMFRIGGAAEGLTSGLSRQGYAHEPGHVKQGDTSKMSMMEKLQSQKSIVEALAPRQPRQDRSMSNFLIDFGLDIASRSPSGSIFSTAAESAKNPFAKFQQAKQMETAYGMSETSEDRALIASLIKGMDEDKLSALMKDVKAGVEAGEFANEAEGIKLLLQKKIYGVLDEPGEKREEWIKWYMTNLQNKADVDPGIARAVAEHQYKIDFKEYPKDILDDLNRTKLYIKESHVVDRTRDKETGDVTEILVNGNMDYYYAHNQIYLDPQTGNLFKRVSKKGQAPVFVRVIEEE